jgi:hypothetical protein
MLLRFVFLFLFFVGLVPALPNKKPANPASLWYTIAYIAPGDVSSLCKDFLYGHSVKTLTVTKTTTSQKHLTTTHTDLTQTSKKTAVTTSTSYATTKKVVTTIVTKGITVVTTVPYVSI